jgi:hypothetical protein
MQWSSILVGSSEQEARTNRFWPVFFAVALLLGTIALVKFGQVLMFLFCANMAFIFYCRGDFGLRRWGRDLPTDKHPKLLRLVYRAQILLLVAILVQGGVAQFQGS